MKAAWLQTVGGPLTVVDRAVPEPAPDGVVVSVRAVRVPSYTRQVVDGTLGYDLPVPLTPGPTCIGRVEQMGTHVFGLAVGQWVLCNSLLSSADATGTPDEILIGWTGSGTPRSARMQQAWRHGSFAEFAHYPHSCLTPLLGAENTDPAGLPFLASVAIAAGGLRRGDLQAGQTVIVNGATGQLGGAAVLFALARGAARVIAVGRNPDKLADLTRLSPRVATVAAAGSWLDELRDLTGGGADLLVDYLPTGAAPSVTLTSMQTLKTGGTAVLVGGLNDELPLPYPMIMRRQLTIRGSFMFDHTTATECWRLVRSGLIDFSVLRTDTYELTDLDQAIDAATNTRGGFDLVTLRPSS